MTIHRSSDYRSNEDDQIRYAAKKLCNSILKKKIFGAVYSGKKKIKTVDEISVITNLTRKQVLDNGKKLVTDKLIHQTRHNNDTAYTKDEDYKGSWKKILDKARDRKKIESIPTKTNPKSGPQTITISIPVNKVKTKQISIDDIQSFNKVKAVDDVGEVSPRIPESKFKSGLLKILDERSNPKDWGGEKNDIYTTKLKINGKRFHAAFALKGPGQKVKKLTPRHMGKNGDQIQRLAASSAQVLVVQYWGEIDQSVVDLMQQLAIAKSYAEGRLIYFGIIDGIDSARLIKAYQKRFK